ncbi:MAG: hypothetical protein ABI877_11115, partial [Gemmatimonadaceae bacterium]
MSRRPGLVARWQAFRGRMRGTDGETLRRLLRRRWMLSTLVMLALFGLASFDAWLATCGFEGCPTAAEIRAYQPSEGERVYDRNNKL